MWQKILLVEIGVVHIPSLEGPIGKSIPCYDSLLCDVIFHASQVLIICVTFGNLVYTQHRSRHSDSEAGYDRLLNQCPARFLGLIGQYPTVSKIKRLNIGNFRFLSLSNFGILCKVPLNGSMNFMRARIWTVYVSNSTGLSVISGQFKPFIVLVGGLNTYMSQPKGLVYIRVQDQKKFILIWPYCQEIFWGPQEFT